MNKKTALKYSKKRDNKINNSGFGSNSNNSNNNKSNIKTLKKRYSFPDSVAQDLFSLIIILFKMYYIQKLKTKFN